MEPKYKTEAKYWNSPVCFLRVNMVRREMYLALSYTILCYINIYSRELLWRRQAQLDAPQYMVNAHQRDGANDLIGDDCITFGQ
jgi:hypothetical protein